MDFSTKLNGFFFIRTKIMDFSRNYHASHEIISFVVIRMDFFFIRTKIMDFSRNYHASHEIISFIVIRMDFSCFNNLTFE